MNKHLYRIVFNKARGVLMAVAENVTSHGQAASATAAPASAMASLTVTLRPMRFALLLAAGLIQPLSAMAQIVADPHAVPTQQPTVLKTANGLPLVNIQTPSAAGVSRNSYRQFDVSQQGAILNNARNNAQTQLGGWVQGNPWLAAGTARVILNEVNSSSPSQLRGYIEVAGDRAQVVIANPAGISCDGCGFINANRATLTTGTPVLAGGNLEGYRVQQGSISISGAGMDARQTDYTDLIARVVQVNAGIWANRLQVNTGASQVRADLSQASALTSSEPTPSYALDVASLGGMYAGKIILVGNEQGLGMRQAGQIGATAGDVVVTQDGRLENTGSVAASGQINVTTSGDISNSGTLYAQGGVAINTATTLANSGRIAAAGADLQVVAQTGVNNSGMLYAQGNGNVQAGSLLDNSGSIVAADNLSAAASQISNHDGATLGATGNVDLQADTVQNRASLIGAGQTLTISASTLDNQQTQNSGQGLQGQTIQLTADTLNNQQGQILADHALTVTSGGLLDNSTGQMNAGTTLTLQDSQATKTLAISNTGGTVLAGQQLTVQSNSVGGDGQLLSKGDLAITVNSDFNNTGTVQASGNASLSTQGALSNQANILANGNLQLSANSLDNGATAQISAANTKVTVGHTLSNRGLIDGQQTWFSAGTLNNLGTGRIYGDQLAIQAGTLNNDIENGTAATIAARGQLDLGIGALNNREHALIYSSGDMAIGGHLDANHHASDSATAINNNSASIQADGNLSLAVGTINNTNEHFASAMLPVGSPQHIIEYQGAGSPTRYRSSDPGVYIYNDESDHLMTPEGSYETWHAYNYSRSTQATTITQSDPASITAGGNIAIQANTLRNDNSHIIAGGALNATVQDLQNLEPSGQQIVTDSGGVTSYWRDHQKGRDSTGSSWAAYNPPDVITDISLGSVKYQQHTMPAGTGISIAPLNTGTLNAQTGSITVPVLNNSLFHINSNPQLSYLVETDPRFANYQSWLSSDYMLNALSADPSSVQKRLGDGFYEQKLLREQVAQLTGRRFLDGYTSDQAQYQALMDQGITVAKAWNLRPGVALSAQQVAQLTSDIVWLVEKEVTLPDGRTTRVLVPQLYVQVKPGDLNGNGALLAGNSVNLQLGGKLYNQGTIAGRTIVSLTADTVNNIGGRLTGSDVLAAARNDLNNLGGSIDAGNSLQVSAGHDLNVTTTSRDNSNAQGSATYLNRVAGLYVTNPSGTTLVASAGRDMNLGAADIGNSGSTGSTTLVAGNNLNLGTVTTAKQQSIVWDGNNHRQDSSSQEVGSQVHSSGDITLLAGNDLNAHAANVTSDQGALQVQAGNDLNLTAGTSRQTVDEAHQHRGTSSAFSSTTTTTRDRFDQAQAVATTLSGNSTALQAGHDIAVTGSNVVSTDGTTLQAGRDIAITAAATTSQEQHDKQQVTSGLFSGGGIGFTLGTREQDIRQRSTSTGATAATIGSTNGDVTVQAGQHYQQTGSNVLAPHGNIDIAAKRIDIIEAHETGTTRTDTVFKQSGLSIALTSPIISALQTGQQMKQAASQTGDSRMQALAGATAALAGKNAYDAISKDPAHAGGVNISISIGASQNKSQTTTNHDGALGSTITAGGNATLRASGDGQNSNLTVQGSDIKAAGNLTLQADNQIQLLAAQNSDSQHSTNSGSSASLGISVGSSGLLFTASASGSRGKADGTDTTWTNTHVDAGKQLTLQSGGDTTLKGAVASGKQVVANVGGNLNMESLQNTSHYDSKQQSLGGSISVGVGVVSGSLSASKSKINSDYASVTEQTGLKSGDGGFQVKVQGNTDLKGAVISSSEQAVSNSKNQFSTGGQLSLSDIENKADYSGDSFGITLSGSSNKKESSLTPSGGGIGSDHGSASSTTRSGISGIAGNVSARTGDAPTGITKIFDVDKVQKELNAQVKITQAFSQQAGQAVDSYVQKNRSALVEQMKKAQSPEERAALKSQLDDLTQQERVMNILIGAVTGQGGTAITKEGLSVAADQMRQLMLEDSAKFAGVTDGKTSYDNLSADSVGVRGDGKKLGGTRWDLDGLCGADNSRCLKTPDGQLQLDAQGRVQFDSSSEGANMSLTDFLKTEEGKKLAGATGGIQGVKGTLFGTPYEAGSWQDKLIESFAGTHDMIGGKLSGLYDEQGNAKRGRDPVVQNAQNAWSATGAIVVSSPFAMAEYLPPQVWNAISILLKAAR